MASFTMSSTMAMLASPAMAKSAQRNMPALVRSSASLPRKAQWASMRTTKPRHAFAIRAEGEASTTEEAAKPKADRPERAPRRKITVKMEDIAVGNTYKGTVTSVQAYGAFVNFGGKSDGLVHISELQAGYVENVADVVSQGQECDVRVLSIDSEKSRVALSMKPEGEQQEERERFVRSTDTTEGTVEMGEDGRPVRGKVATRGKAGGRGGGRKEQAPPPVKKGEKYMGVVKSMLPFGAFVELKLEVDGKPLEGVQGLLHVSEISETRVSDPSEVLSEGQEVEVRIQAIQGTKLNLTMREQVDIAEVNAAANLLLGESATALEMALKKAGLSREMFPEGEAAPAAAAAPEPVKEEAPPAPEPVAAEASPAPEPVVETSAPGAETPAPATENPLAAGEAESA